MRTNFTMTLALAALLSMGTAAIAAARTCRAPAPNESGYGSRHLSLEECQQASAADTPAVMPSNAGVNTGGDMPTDGGIAPNAGSSAHRHPDGRRLR
jgi:hypothetical protein